jgi:hypothetical protein
MQGAKEFTPAQQAMFEDLRQLLIKHVQLLAPIEILAIVSQFTGVVLAGQGTRFSPPVLMETILRNLEIGQVDGLHAIREVSQHDHHAGHA